jgi:hypothetical protein
MEKRIKGKIKENKGKDKTRNGSKGKRKSRRFLRGSLKITRQGAVRPSFTLGQAQGERGGYYIRRAFSVRAEPVEARFCQ